jgi:hypothetical protein
LEYWSVGILGYGEMIKWVIGTIHSDEVQDLYKFKLPLKTNIPIFHHSIIPFVRQKNTPQ